MTETDARMSFERHATSKIKNADDLFAIKTKGFRGEALASMAAIAHLELKTKIVDIDLGSQILIEGSEIVSQEPVSCNNGTSISIKNLFYNVPARRNFLKSNGVETRHIIDEFERVALTHPDIHFTMNHNGNEVFNLPSSGLRQRVVNVLGKKYNDRLVPIEEYTNILNITGYIVKPEFSKRTRGEQFFFVNNRFIKSTYLNHSVTSAYRELIAKDQFPSYFIYLEVEPNTIDINIHPTKTEVKFEDEKSIYAIINSAVKNSIGKYNIAPSLDFSQETSFNIPPLKQGQTIAEPVIKVNPGFNPFEMDKGSPVNSFTKKNISQQQLSANLDFLDQNNSPLVKSSDNITENAGLEQNWSGLVEAEKEVKTYQLHRKFILTQTGSGLLIINQQRAHQQILFEQFIFELNRNTAETQKLMFPKTIELKNSDFELILEVLSEIKHIGFDIEVFGKNTLAINGLPIGVEETNCEKIIEEFIEQIKNNANEISVNNRNKLAMSLAKSSSIKNGRKLSAEEMNAIVDQLFACETPYHSPNGKPIIIKINEEELDQRFDKK